MTSTVPTQTCPACNTAVPVNPRYPRYACRECVTTAVTTRDGQPAEVIQSHSFVTGAGLRLRSTGSTVTEQPTTTDPTAANCRVRGHDARASEAHMGGVEVTVL